MTDLCLRNVARLKDLNIFTTESPDLARTQSKVSSERHRKNIPLGLLDGVPIAVKDNFCIKDMRTTCASRFYIFIFFIKYHISITQYLLRRMLLDFVPSYNATVYERLHQHGAILLGKTNLDQFGMGSGTIDSSFGPTRNVWIGKWAVTDDWHIAGGSSGGSAVAVATGICFA